MEQELKNPFKDYNIRIDTRKTINPRSLLLEKFLKEINTERKRDRFPLMTPVQLGMKVAHLKGDSGMEALQYLYSLCLSSKNRKIKNTDDTFREGSFGKCFFYELKMKQ